MTSALKQYIQEQILERQRQEKMLDAIEQGWKLFGALGVIFKWRSEGESGSITGTGSVWWVN